jgi:hypothetical protein
VGLDDMDGMDGMDRLRLRVHDVHPVQLVHLVHKIPVRRLPEDVKPAEILWGWLSRSVLATALPPA